MGVTIQSFPLCAAQKKKQHRIFAVFQDACGAAECTLRAPPHEKLMFSTRVIRGSLPLTKPPRVKLCNGQYSSGHQLASNVYCCAAKHARPPVIGAAMARLKSTAMEPVADQLPGNERLPLAGQLVLSGSAASTTADATVRQSMVDGYSTSAMPMAAAAAAAVFPAAKEHQTRPIVLARASTAAGGAPFRPCSNTSASTFASASGKRWFTSDSTATSDEEDSTKSASGNAGAAKTASTRKKKAPANKVPKARKEVLKKAPPANKVPKTRKEAFKQARNAGVTDRLIKGGGVPRDNSDSGTLPSGQEGNLTPSWNEKDYQAGGVGAGQSAAGGAGLPAVKETAVTSADFLSDG
ncbi:unnamed protein product, partial [Laminaria digitata]